jgi:hypothetical protein
MVLGAGRQKGLRSPKLNVYIGDVKNDLFPTHTLFGNLSVKRLFHR